VLLKRLGTLKIFNDLNENRTRDFPASSTAPRPTELSISPSSGRQRRVGSEPVSVSRHLSMAVSPLVDRSPFQTAGINLAVHTLSKDHGWACIRHLSHFVSGHASARWTSAGPLLPLWSPPITPNTGQTSSVRK
jgi:hypothetical protein